MKIYLVGGAVRDKLLGHPVQEKDWVVVGATPEDMLKLGYRQVGKEFPVFLHPKTGEEYALARMERKVKPGYQGFTFDTSPEVSIEEDLIRRDLTINAMAEDKDSHERIDPYGGEADLNNKLLRHVSPAFAEDPVRILRVGRFLARYAIYGFQVHPDTIQLMRAMVAKGEVNALVSERVWKELERALGEKNPEKFFAVLDECGALPILFPHLQIASKSMAALKAAANMQAGKPVRFAALLYELSKSDIKFICERYRVPTAYQQLALLTAQHYKEALRAHDLSAEELLSLLSTLDVFRRDDRFQQFLHACEAIAEVESKAFAIEWLQAAATIAKSVDVQALIAQGYTNATLAAELKKERAEKLSAWLKSQK